MSTQSARYLAWSDRPTSKVEELRYLAATVRELEHVQEQQQVTVQLLRSWGVSWTVIAVKLGVTRQAARQRFGKDVLV